MNIPQIVWMLWITIKLHVPYIISGRVRNLMWCRCQRAWFGLLQGHVALVENVISTYMNRGRGDLCSKVLNVVAVFMVCKILVSTLVLVPKDVRLVKV